MKKILSAPSLALAAWLVVSSASVQATPPLQAEAAVEFQREMRKNVGNVLPFGLVVKNRHGDEVDLRSALGSQTVLIKIDPDCPPCEEITAFLREHREWNGDTKVIVLMVKDTGDTIPDLPPQVTFLHTTADMRSDGFLAGKYTPTTFYFDEGGRLVKRDVGAPASLGNLVQFPPGLSAKL